MCYCYCWKRAWWSFCWFVCSLLCSLLLLPRLECVYECARVNLYINAPCSLMYTYVRIFVCVRAPVCCSLAFCVHATVAIRFAFVPSIVFTFRYSWVQRRCRLELCHLAHSLTHTYMLTYTHPYTYKHSFVRFLALSHSPYLHGCLDARLVGLANTLQPLSHPQHLIKRIKIELDFSCSTTT